MSNVSQLKKIPCTVEILTRNSAQTLEQCLESVKDFAEILILDGNSTDSTRQIAEKYGCRIIKQYNTDEQNVAIRDYSEVRNKGLRLATFDWFMFIDSDEYLSKEAGEEIRFIIERREPRAYAWWQLRKYVLDGKIIECASTYPNQQIRLFHRKWVKEFIKPIHERIEILPGTTVGRLNQFEFVPRGSLQELDQRWKHYTEKELAMNPYVPRKKILRLALKQGAIFVLYTFRYARNLFFCRGPRMPLRFEWAQHKYLLKHSWHLFKRALLPQT